MAVVLDTNMKLFADRMHITSSRMIQDYGLKTVEEIIQSEAEKGNQHAVKYAMEMYNSPEKLVKVFRLNDVENKFVILHRMDDRTRKLVLPLLDSEDLVMGLYFFTQDALLEMMKNVDIAELVNVVMGAFPLQNVVMMYTEDDLAQFFQHDEIEKRVVAENLKSMPPEMMIKFVEGVTGQPAKETNPIELINNIQSLPDDKFKDFMSLIDPDIQRQLVFQMSKDDNKYLQLFPNETYLKMLNTLMKPDMVKPMVNLEKDSLLYMIQKLPKDLMAIVGAQVDTKQLAYFLLDGHMKILEEAWMI